MTMQCMEVWGGNQASDNGVIMPGLDAWVVSRPYQGDEAGGDIHYLSSCNTGRITRILISDVSGHGQQVAKVATALRSLMRRYVNFVDQTRFVRELNTEFAGLADIGSFATAVVATFWEPTGHLIISNAGHPRPLWYRAKSRSWQAINRKAAASDGLANIPLGIAEPTSYDELSIKLSHGDLILLYTDSLIEAAAPGGRQLGEEGLIQLLGTLDVSHPETLIPSLLNAVDSHAGRPPADDVTALLLRPNDLRPRIGFTAGIVAGWRIVEAFFASLKPGGMAFPRPQISIAVLFGAFFSGLNRRLGGGKSAD
jgi:serine phosphatase RsbU (regulator of sigma subunit)